MATPGDHKKQNKINYPTHHQGGEMKITEKWLQEQSACQSGIERFLAQKETDGVKVVKKLISRDKLDWANWLIVRIMSYKQYVSYAVYAADQVIADYEKQYPKDDRPRKAIEAAKECIKDPSEENKSAADSACSAAKSAKSAKSSAWSARSAARSAAKSAAKSAADSADSACSAAGSAMQKKIIAYGIKLLNKE